MRKEASFDTHWDDGWPDLGVIEACFTDPKRRQQMFAKCRDGGSFSVEGLYGADGLPPRAGLVTANLFLHMNPEHGAARQYTKWDGRIQKQQTKHSKGDLNLIRQFVRSFHDTPVSVGLFIPFEKGWTAIKEFIETEGELPKSIAWVDDHDLPPGTFPDP